MDVEVEKLRKELQDAIGEREEAKAKGIELDVIILLIKKFVTFC